MRTDLVVVFHVRQQYVTEMPLAEHNNMVKALPSDRTDQSLSKSVLPWGTWRRRSIANAHYWQPPCWPGHCLRRVRWLAGAVVAAAAVAAVATAADSAEAASAEAASAEVTWAVS